MIEMAKFYEMMKPILNVLKDGGCFESKQIRELMNQQFPLTNEEIERKLDRGRKPDLSEEVQWALLYLTRAGLLNNPNRGIYTITDEGLRVLAENPEIIDAAYLYQYEAFKLFMQSRNKSANDSPNKLFEKVLLVCAPLKTCSSYNAIIKRHPHFLDFVSVRYDVFINDLINSIVNSTKDYFKQKYTQCKVLILHDIEFIIGKEQTQEELYHIIQTRIDSNLKTVLISSKAPDYLSEHLISQLYEVLTIEAVINQIPDSASGSDSFVPQSGNFSENYIDIQDFKQTLQMVRKQLDNNEIDEIPLNSRPKMLNFDFESDSYVIISYSRKDFEKVYLLLAQLYNEGYRFWYDNGMKGTQKWLEEYRDKFKNPNCLGSITFFSSNYISDSTKEELEIIYSSNGYEKKNVMISLVPLSEIDPDKALKNAIANDRITLENAYFISSILKEIIEEEKKKTIHRYSSETDIPFLVDKIGAAFNIRVSSGSSIQSTHFPDLKNEQRQSDDSDSFKIVNGELFSYNGNRTSVIIPNGVTSIRGGAFRDCKSIVDITIPDSVTHIGMFTFHNCVSLMQVNLPKTMSAIDMGIFDGCVSLKNITLPNGIKEIGSDAFEICRSLESITIPEGVIRIGSGAFNGCSALRSITIPTSLQSIGTEAFFRCDRLSKVSYLGTKKQWENVTKGDRWQGIIKSVICVDGIIQL